jgi:hypothetical protein
MLPKHNVAALQPPVVVTSNYVIEIIPRKNFDTSSSCGENQVLTVPLKGVVSTIHAAAYLPMRFSQGQEFSTARHPRHS